MRLIAKSKEVQEIKNNGVVQVEFYEENRYGGSITIRDPGVLTWTNGTNPYTDSWWNYYT